MFWVSDRRGGGGGGGGGGGDGLGDGLEQRMASASGGDAFDDDFPDDEKLSDPLWNDESDVEVPIKELNSIRLFVILFIFSVHSPSLFLLQDDDVHGPPQPEIDPRDDLDRPDPSLWHPDAPEGDTVCIQTRVCLLLFSNREHV